MLYTSQHPFVYVTADVVAFSIRAGALQVLLVRRGRPPYAGRLAFPGGFVDPHEGLEQAARRELVEETSVRCDHVPLVQLGAYGDPGRDPRHRVVSTAYVAVLGPGIEPTAGDDAAEAAWHDVRSLLGEPDGVPLAFDHDEILRDALAWLGRQLEHTDLAAAFLRETFTIAELREVYEVVWGRALDAGNFQHKVTGADGFLSETGERRHGGGPGRPAALYRRADDA